MGDRGNYREAYMQSRAELRHRMHSPPASVGEWLHKVTLGYYQYHAVPDNLHRLNIFAERHISYLGWAYNPVGRRSQRTFLPSL
jgi:hypothetical protein